jgi:hypothetical protein
MATWHDKTADQLEQLNRRNVDPLAVDATNEVAKRLRAIASSLRGVPIDVDAISQKAYLYTQRLPGYGWPPYGWWPHRGWSWNPWRNPWVLAAALAPKELKTNIPEVRGEIAKVIADDQKRRMELWTQIDQIIAETRRKLAEKYKTEF